LVIPLVCQGEHSHASTHAEPPAPAEPLLEPVTLLLSPPDPPDPEPQSPFGHGPVVVVPVFSGPHDAIPATHIIAPSATDNKNPRFIDTSRQTQQAWAPRKHHPITTNAGTNFV
jgi:hypothetical protein